MVQVLEQQGSVAGRIGKGFGQGLSENLPQEINRYRLSEGVKRLGENKNKLTPVQQAAELYGLPGGAEAAPSILPFFREQQQKNAALNRSKGRGNVPVTGTQPTTQIPGDQGVNATPDVISREPTKLQENGLATPSQISRYKDSLLQPATNEQINVLRDEILDSGMTQDPQQARNIAVQELDQNRLAQQAKNESFRTDLNNRVKLSLQKGGLGDFQDVSGEIQRDLLDQGEYLVNERGYTPEKAAQKMDDILLDLGKTATQTKTTGSMSNWFTSTKSKINDLKNQRKEFEKYGFTEQFDNLASSAMGITPQKLASVVDPVKNKEIDDTFDKYNDVKPEKKKGLGQFVELFETPMKTMKEKDLNRIIENIRPDDNILSIEQKFREKGIDVNEFKNRITDLENENRVALTPKQKRELQKPLDNTMYGDFWFDLRS